MHKMLAQNDRERGTMNPISGLTMSMAHSNCMRVLREIKYEQRRDEDWASPHHCEDGEEGAMDEEPESEAGEKCEEGEQVTTECAPVGLSIAMAAAVAHAASGPIASTGNEMDVALRQTAGPRRGSVYRTGSSKAVDEMRRSQTLRLCLGHRTLPGRTRS